MRQGKGIIFKIIFISVYFNFFFQVRFPVDTHEKDSFSYICQYLVLVIFILRNNDFNITRIFRLCLNICYIKFFSCLVIQLSQTCLQRPKVVSRDRWLFTVNLCFESVFGTNKNGLYSQVWLYLTFVGNVIKLSREYNWFHSSSN